MRGDLGKSPRGKAFVKVAIGRDVFDEEFNPSGPFFACGAGEKTSCYGNKVVTLVMLKVGGGEAENI